MQIKFRFFTLPAKPTLAYPDQHSSLSPIIPVRLIHQSNHLDIGALIDSGASDCIFHAEVGEALGLQIENERWMEHFGVGGQKIKTYFHDIKMEIGGHRFSCYAGFSFDVQPKPGLLGLHGFFDKFTVVLDYKKEAIELKWK